MPGDPPLGSRPRQAHGIAARGRVYDEAIRQFGEHGIAATRVEDVVAAADVAWGTFFRYFPRKEDVLLEAAVRHYRERVLPLVQGGLEDPARSSRAIALDLLLLMLVPGEHPAPVHGAALREVVERRTRFAAMLDEGELPLVMLVVRILQHGVERGEVRDDVDVFTLAGVLTAGTVFPTLFAFYSALPGTPVVDPPPDPAPLIERSFGVVWRGIEARA